MTPSFWCFCLKLPELSEPFKTSSTLARRPMRCFLEISENCLFLAVGLQKKVTKVERLLFSTPLRKKKCFSGKRSTKREGCGGQASEKNGNRWDLPSSACHRKLVPRRDLLLGAGLATAPDSPMQPLDFFWGLCPACSGKTPPVPY